MSDDNESPLQNMVSAQRLAIPKSRYEVLFR
jgi:hypothetical protein